MTKSDLIGLLVPIIIITVLPFESALAQGSIFGTVTNSDFSVPGDNEISFWGYLDNTDEEIRIESSTGAGYDGGNWYDDLQNYLTEAPGNPYDYHFINTNNSEGVILSGFIPDNSFQQENLYLEPVVWPAAVIGLSGSALSFSEIEISWTPVFGHTYHVYRRLASSGGSLFRIDDPEGSLFNAGVVDDFFVDSFADSGLSFDYVVIAEDVTGLLGVHSAIISVTAVVSNCLAGDSNGDGAVNLGDAGFLINYIFYDGAGPEPIEQGDANCDGATNLGDAGYIVNYVFFDGLPPLEGCCKK